MNNQLAALMRSIEWRKKSPAVVAQITELYLQLSNPKD